MKKYVEYEEYLSNRRKMNGMIYHGWEFIHEKSVVKIVVGLCLFGIGVLTLPIPTGSVFLIAVGLSLVSSGGIDLVALRKSLYWRIKTRLMQRRNN